MIKPDEAQALAHKAAQAYVNACGCGTVEDVGNALLKMASVVGLFLVATQGQDTAVAMLEGVAAHIAKPEFSKPCRMEKLQ